MVKTTDPRIKLMIQGANVLNNWLQELVNQGLGNIDTGNNSYWENIAALMVDHKLGGLARRIRRCNTHLQDNENWLDDILSEIGELHLITKGLTQLDQHSFSMQTELLTLAGKSTTKKEILATKPSIQTCLTLGLSYGQEEQLSFRKTWYWLKKDKRFVFELEFKVGRKMDYSKSLPVGMTHQVDTYYYPSLMPSRVLINNTNFTSDVLAPKMLLDFSSMQKHFAKALGQYPWLIEYPCAIQKIQILLHRNETLLIDQANQVLEIPYKRNAEDLLSLYANKENTNIFGTWNGRNFQPISLLVDGFVIELSEPPFFKKKNDSRDWSPF